MRALTLMPCSWRRVNITGGFEKMTKLIDSLVAKGSAAAIRELSFIDVRFPRSRSLPTNNQESRQVARFFSATERLFAQAKRLSSLLVDESNIACGIYELGGARFFGSLIKHCQQLKSVTLLSAEEADYVGDGNLLLLSQLPSVESFVDGQAFGLSVRGLCFLADGCKSLKRLKLNTECKNVSEVVQLICSRPTLQKLTLLGLTHFHDSLHDAIDILAQGLGMMKQLDTLHLDLQFTRFGDALGRREWNVLMNACPCLKTVHYTVSIESFIGQDADETEYLLEDECDVALSDISASLSSVGAFSYSSVGNDTIQDTTHVRLSNKKHQGYFVELEQVRELFAMRNVELHLNWNL